MTDNRRLEPRKNAFRFGSLQIEGQAGKRDCLVWDESERGAMIEVSTEEPVPDRFTLTIGEHRRPRTCTVMRRDGRRLGVEFA
ncbi:PilZ domain-containing protein [Methylobacterium haplocladii]|uniref:PilZ domain-containing protein n=1 Tax=Methylobacterium haplocladii TaxID=1176176 RepID=A0A512IPP2_9HYPH|nr:PilZ domain-containing protein [Methylobacterium haplocladii]GEO99642.1 hypothetical protein MHA02_20300 [Methylobacterium haplocladii]GJD83336.1 hypothetical protein HPGCJGGD_1202 [Methylobacterium haplocladii]GLS58211.1 hypothetical protein GCM10007887_08680 [Methylobacterium haplocladii]